jgi:hypothetical protein
MGDNLRNGNLNVRRGRPTYDPREEGESHNGFDLFAALGNTVVVT